MRRTLLLAGLLLAACGGNDTVGTVDTEPTSDTSDRSVDDVPDRALRAPGSAADLDGVVVRYYEPLGEGPGFDLRFLENGAVTYERLERERPTGSASTYDVEHVATLIDGVEPNDLAAGAHDCMPEVDGSAPRLSLAAFEVDFCYTNSADHPLVDFVRSERARLDAMADDAGFDPPSDFDDVLARYSMPGGECDRCDFETTFLADGTAQLRSSRGDHDSRFDAEALGALVDGFEPDTFTIGETNCGREVDGNAPVLEVPTAVIDLCFWEVDVLDPLFVFVVAGHDRIEAERDAGLAGAAVIARVTAAGGLCPDGICATVWEFRADGTWTADDGDSVTRGSYDPIPLVEAVSATYVRSPIIGPFTGTCPTAYDGAEFSYEVLDPTTGESVLSTSTCVDELDPEHPLVVAVTGALSAATAD